MTAELGTTAGAVSGVEISWQTIDWSKPPNDCASAASAYREGDAGQPLGQGESFATAVDPLV